MSRPQKVVVGIGTVVATSRWTGATITVTAYRDDIQRIAVLEFNEPYELEYFRERLDEIEAGWRKRLDAIGAKT